MFRGASKVTIDDKGRVVIPARQRALLAAADDGRCVVTVHRDRCLLVYPLAEWDQVQARIMTLPGALTSPPVRALQRLMVGHATDVEIDGHGRIALSAELREFAGLSRAAMLVGQGKRLELWDESRWNEQCEASLETGTEATAVAAALEALSL